MNADIVIRDANIVTMTEPGQKGEAQAIAIRGGLIQAAGTNQEIEVMIGSDTQVLCLAGKMVLPGFIDTHVHFLSTGMGQIQPTISGMTKTDDILSVIDEKVRQAAPGEPVLVHGYDAGEVDRQLTKKDLEKLAPRNPLLVDDIGGHSCIANGKAIELINLPPNVLGLRPLENGEPSGVLVADANNIARYRYYGLMDDSIRVEAFNLAAKLANRYGITTIHALDGGSEDKHSWLPARDIDILLREQDNLPVRTVIYFQSVRVDMALDWNLPRIGGCVYIDGAYGEHTAALIEPYFDDPTSRGCLYFSDDELDDFVEKAHRAGLQISMHAIGDAAIEQLLSAYERTLVKYPRQDHRHRIEHFSLPTSDQIERVAGLGVAVAMQPNFAFMP
ncbi:MAG: amidohydrolase family protein, partial [Anaerolineales bacterium]|nr:amidohydrolase family protein [Anaerolineales bacterium]